MYSFLLNVPALGLTMWCSCCYCHGPIRKTGYVYNWRNKYRYSCCQLQPQLNFLWLLEQSYSIFFSTSHKSCLWILPFQILNNILWSTLWACRFTCLILPNFFFQKNKTKKPKPPTRKVWGANNFFNQNVEYACRSLSSYESSLFKLRLSVCMYVQWGKHQTLQSWLGCMLAEWAW